MGEECGEERKMHEHINVFSLLSYPEFFTEKVPGSLTLLLGCVFASAATAEQDLLFSSGQNSALFVVFKLECLF